MNGPCFAGTSPWLDAPSYGYTLRDDPRFHENFEVLSRTIHSWVDTSISGSMSRMHYTLRLDQWEIWPGFKLPYSKFIDADANHLNVLVRAFGLTERGVLL